MLTDVLEGVAAALVTIGITMAVGLGWGLVVAGVCVGVFAYALGSGDPQ